VPPGRPDRSMKLGLAYVPPDRKRQGAIVTLTARENMSLIDLPRFWRYLHLRRKPEMRVAKEWFERLGVRPADGLNNRFDTFSGGNQQKIVMAKGLRSNPRVFLVDEPTQGVDVGARQDLHDELRDAASHGTAVVVASSDTRELGDLCDRVLILRNGLIAAQLTGGDVNAATISHFVLDSNSSEVTST
ncbi:MAG: ATP-binding cassette domain-containing protein, partial [Trebonia sp.]